MDAVVLGNFDITADTITMAFPHDGKWYDYLSGESIDVTAGKYFFSLKAGEFHLLTDKLQETPDLAIAPAKINADLVTIEGNLEIYPNPSDGNFNIYVKGEGSIDVYIYDVSGRMISHTLTSGTGKRIIDASSLGISLSSGVYVCKTESSEGVSTKKFIIR